jgi:hypothetical protein
MLGQRGGTLNNNRTRFENLTLAAIHQLVLSFLSKEWGDPHSAPKGLSCRLSASTETPCKKH